MANDAATLRGYLQSALRDSTNATWTQTEMDNAIARAVRDLYPRIAKPIAPESFTDTLVNGTYFYSLGARLVEVTGIDWIDTNGNERGAITSWEIVGDVLGGSGQLHLPPVICDTGGTIRYYGFGRYDVSSNYIPDDFVPIVIAKAEVELLHYLKSDRARFLQWSEGQQDTNVSVNELMQLINSAEQRARTLVGSRQSFRRPKPGRR